MKYSYILALAFVLVLFATPVSAAPFSDFTAYGDAWRATNDTHTMIKWNTTGIHHFVATGNTTLISNYAVIAGGGPGGTTTAGRGGGGGGSGGILIGTSVSISGIETIIVGNGSIVTGTNGQNSSFTNDGTTIESAGGGSGGSNEETNGNDGGSGGAGSGNTGTGGLGIAGQGNDGGDAAANNGGGGGSVNTTGGNAIAATRGGLGADGIDLSDIFGIFFGLLGKVGGGGGGGSNEGSRGYGGLGGGGWGADITHLATSGEPETGGGGGGGRSGSSYGYGGSGVVIFIFPNLYASFTPVGETTGSGNVTVQFTDTSLGDPLTYNYTYQGTSAGNNTETVFSTSPNPRVSFIPDGFSSGNYQIKLNITNMNGFNVSVQSTWVNVSTLQTLSANFTATPESGEPPLLVTFTDTSSYGTTKIDAWNWSFGDGSVSTLQSPPAHIYTLDADYVVNLTITNTSYGHSSTKLTTIRVFSDINPLSEILFKPDTNILRNSSIYNRTVQIDKFTNASYVRGNVTFDPLQVNILGVYANTTDIPTATLSDSSIDYATGTIYFNVTKTPCGFGVVPTPESVIDIQMLYFNYTSSTFTPSAWGNVYVGNCTTELEYPIHNKIDSPLTYSWQTFSNFAVNNTSPVISETVVKFVPIDTNQSANRWLWNFGDGITFLSTNRTGESHVYSGVPTAYSPSLTAYIIENSSITNTTTKIGLITTIYNASYINADFTASPLSGTPGVAVAFTDLSAYGDTTGLIYNWSFGDTYSSTPYSNAIGNVTHVYPVAGTYTVNLTITNTHGSDHEEKLNYIVVATNQNTQTTFYTPQLYRFHFQNLIGTPLGGLSVTITPLNLTMPAEWEQQLIGIQPSVNLQGGIISGITGTTGTFGAPMFTPLGYCINISGTAYSGDVADYSIIEYPPSTGGDIIISLPTSVTGFTSVTPTPAFITYDIYNQTISNTTQIFSVNFNDPTCVTNITVVTVTNQSGYVLNTTTYTGTPACNVVNNFTYIQGTTSPAGDIINYGLSAYVSTAGGWNNISETYDSNTGSSLTGRSTYDQWAAIIIIVLISSAFTASTVYIGTFGVGLMGLFFYYVTKWFTPGVTGSVFITMCVFWMCIGAIGIIAKKGRGGFF